MSKSRFVLIFTASLAFALAMFYYPWLSNSKAFYLFDITNYYEPSLKLIGENLRRGQFMLWNPYSYCGMPQIAITEPGLFYPPNWLFAVLPFSSALALVLVLHQLLAGVGSSLLILSLGWGVGPACLAGVAAGLCAYMFSLQTNYTLMAAAAWSPLLLWALKCLQDSEGRKKALYFVIAALSTTFMILTGRPEIFGPALLFIGGVVLFSAAWKLSDGQEKLLVLNGTVLSVVALGLGVLLAAPGILPAVEWVKLSPRAEGLIPADTLFWSANWYDFVCMILPQPLGDMYLRTNEFANLALANPALEPYFASAFLGPIILTLALFGLFDKTFRPRLLLLAVMIIFIILAAGRFTPVAEYLLYAIPGLSVVRYPVKLLFLPVFCLILFAARGLYAVMQERLSKNARITAMLIWVLLAAVGFVLWTYRIPLFDAISTNHVTFIRSKTDLAMVVAAQHLIGQSCLLMAGIGLLTVLLCWWRQLGRVSNLVIVTMLVAGTYGLFMFDAYLFSYHPAPSDYFDQGCYLKRKLAKTEDLSRLENIKSNRVVNLSLAGLLQPYNLESGDPIQKTICHYQLSRQMLQVSTHFDHRYGSMFGYLLAETADYRNLYIDIVNKSHLSGKKIISLDRRTWKSDVPLYRFCQMTSTAYILGQIDKYVYGRFSKIGILNPQFFQLLIDDPSWNARIYKVKNPLPRTYLSYCWQWCDTQEKAINKIVTAESSGFDPSKCTLLEGGTDKTNLPASPSPHVQRRQGHVELLENTANRLTISADTAEPALLVLTDHFYPGWVARVDNREVQILRANGVLRAVFVPQGEHTIEFNYEPNSLKLALAISALAAFLMLLIAGYCFFKK